MHAAPGLHLLDMGEALKLFLQAREGQLGSTLRGLAHVTALRISLWQVNVLQPQRKQS